MKRSVLVMISVLFFAVCSTAQEKTSSGGRVLPKVTVRTLTGEQFSTEKFSNDGKPFIIDFWATWCKPCVEELTTLHDEYADWKKETGVKIIAISIDDARTMNRVAPFVNGKGWTFETYVDPNGDFKRALNVNMPPHTFVVNGKGEIVWQHVGFVEGDQEELIEVVKKVAAGTPLK
jgi:cytochrome c biogenesis protein CcmG, thiol:disulfide interchange protein DsbE